MWRYPCLERRDGGGVVELRREGGARTRQALPHRFGS
jgi:hypothetical protein